MPGAMNPMILIRNRLHKRRLYHPIWKDHQDFPWNPSAPTLTDLVAAVVQDELRFMGRKDGFWKVYDLIWKEVFGITFTEWKEKK